MNVYNSYTGGSSVLDPGNIASIDELKRYVSDRENIAESHVLLLVAPSGSQLRMEHIKPGIEVYIYDRELIFDPKLAESRLESSRMVLQAIPGKGTDGSQAGIRDQFQSGLKIASDFENIQKEVSAINKGTQLALAHMSSNLRALRHHLRAAQRAFRDLGEDFKAVSNWKSTWEIISQLPKLGKLLPGLLDKGDIDACYHRLQEYWDHVRNCLKQAESGLESIRVDSAELLVAGSVSTLPKRPDTERLKSLANAAEETKTRSVDNENSENMSNEASAVSEFEDLRNAWAAEKHAAQTSLISVSQKISSVQRHSAELRILITDINKDLKEVDQLKSHVAKVIDLPFVFGAYLAEGEQRTQWINQFRFRAKDSISGLRELYMVETERIERWTDHYNKTELMTLLPPLPALPRVREIEFDENESAGLSDVPSFSDYMQKLRSAGLTEVYEDLKAEMEGMAAITSSQAKSFRPNQQYESRIRRLENMLLQVRLENSTSNDSDGLKEENSRLKAENDAIKARVRDIGTRLYEQTYRLDNILELTGLKATREDDNYEVNRVKGLGRTPLEPPAVDPELLDWSSKEKFAKFLHETNVDMPVFRDSLARRFGDVERLARKLQSETRSLRERTRKAEQESLQRLALSTFKPGDLILFLPTRDPSRLPNPWAAFNAGAPHCFLHPSHVEQLQGREYLIARAARVEARQVKPGDGDTENPFGLAEGMKWCLITVHGHW